MGNSQNKPNSQNKQDGTLTRNQRVERILTRGKEEEKIRENAIKIYMKELGMTREAAEEAVKSLELSGGKRKIRKHKLYKRTLRKRTLRKRNNRNKTKKKRH